MHAIFESSFSLVLTFCLWMTCYSAYTSPSLNTTFTLNANIIQNPNISTPVISPSSPVDFGISKSGWTTSVANVQYLNICLHRASSLLACPTYSGVTCGWQFLDMDSSFQNEYYFQTFNLTAGDEYQLKFDWISEISYLSTSTGITVIWNGVTIGSFYDNSCTLRTSTYYVTSVNGINKVVFGGIGIMDSQGLLIRNIRLQKLTYSSAALPATNSSVIDNTTSPTTTNLSNTSSIINQNQSTSSNTTSSPASPSNTSTINATANSTNASVSANTTTQNSTNYLQSNSTTSTNDTSPNTNSSSDTINSTYSTNSSSSTSESTTYSSIYSFSDLQTLFNSTQYQKLFKLINFMKDFSIVQMSNNIMSAKQNMKFLLGFMLEFNHFILYNYHLLNYTLMSNLILSGMQAMDDEKGKIVDQYIYPVLSTSPAQISTEFQQQNSLPVNINNIVTDYSQRPNGIMLELTDAFLLDFPVTLLIFMFGLLLFKMLFRFRISLLFRQYSLFGYLLYVFLEGKIEIMTFYFLSEVLLLVSSSFIQKLKVVIIVFSYFLIFTFAVGSILFLKALYGKLVKYIYQNCRSPATSSFQMSLSFGLYNILLGFIHRIMLPFPLLQLYLLLAVEIAYLSLLVRLLCRRFYDNSLLAITLCLMNLSRLSLLVTFLIYELWPELEYTVSKAQEYSFYSFLIMWVCSSFISLLEKMYIIYTIMRYSCKSESSNISRSKKVTPFGYLSHSRTLKKKEDTYLKDQPTILPKKTDNPKKLTKKINHIFFINQPVQAAEPVPRAKIAPKSITTITTARRKKWNRMTTKLTFTLK